MGERVPCQTTARSRSPGFKRYTEGAVDTMILEGLFSGLEAQSEITDQLKQALEAFREALESHHRSLEGLESALTELEETLTGREDRQERPQGIRQGGEARRGLDLLSMREISQELEGVMNPRRGCRSLAGGRGKRRRQSAAPPKWRAASRNPSLAVETAMPMRNPAPRPSGAVVARSPASPLRT